MLVTRIIELMEKNHVTAKQLTSELELSNSSITEWKKGKGTPSTKAVIKIANYFGVSTDYLLMGVESQHASISSEDAKWLSLIHQLPCEAQYEFRGEIKGYLKRINEESVAADNPQKTGTDFPK